MAKENNGFEGQSGKVQDVAEQPELLRFALDHISEEAYLSDERARILYVNQTACRVLGYSREELLGMTIADIDPDYPLERWPQHWEELRAGGSFIIESRHRKKDGSVFPVEISINYFEHDGRGYNLGLVRDITDRKTAEEALRDTKELFSLFMKHSPVYVYIKEVTPTESRVLQASDNFQDMIGIAGRNMTGKTMAELFPQEFARKISADDWAVVSRGNVLKLDEELNGRYYTTFKFPLKQGERTLLAGYTIDVTERKLAEVEIRRNAARLASLLRISQYPVDDEQLFLDFALHEAIALTESAIAYLYFYDEGTREFNLNSYSLDVMKECTIAERKTCYELDKTGIWGEAVRQRRPILLNDFQAEHPLKKGYPVGHAQISKFLTVPVIIGGLVVAVIGVANKTTDYTDVDVLQLGLLMDSVWNMVQRARSERLFNESERKYRNLFESMSDAVFILDLNGNFIDVNRTGYKRLGYTKEELLALHISRLDPPEFAVLVPERLALIRERGAAVFESVHLCKDGTLMPVEINSRLLNFEGRQVYFSVVRDITERKRLEQEIIRAEKLESIGTLAGGIAHDFNNLLQGVFGFISLARITINQKEQALEMLEEAEKALHLSVNLTAQLLTFSKGGTPVKRRVNLQTVIENAVKFSMSGSRADYRLTVDDDLRPADADEGQIFQVVQNIVLNADHAMPEGGTIVITARNTAAPGPGVLGNLAPGNYVEVAIRDTGIGIPEKYLAKIFDPYFTTKEKGSGLGLAASYSIVKNHGGLIDVKSEVGKGSVFTLFLPAAEGGSEVQARPAAPITSRRCRLLVLEDEEIVRKVARELLRELGHDVEFAEHGRLAIEKYRQAREAGNPYDIVILDLTIRGGLGGLETLQCLREIDAGVKAVASSGYSESPVMSDYEKYGFRACLGKPYKIEQLQDMLNSLLT